MKANTPDECNKLLGEAFNKKDIQSAISLFEKDAIFTDQLGKEHIGLEAIQMAEQLVIDLNPEFKIETLGVSTYGDISVLRSKWSLKGQKEDGTPVEMSHNGIEVVRKQNDGSWKYIIDNPFYAD